MTDVESIVVLGGPTQEESFMRVDAALTLHGQVDAPQIITTGAHWAFESGDQAEQRPTMGARMRDRMIDGGVSEHIVKAADTSLDTIGDALAAKYLLREAGANKVTVVTTESHLGRAAMIFSHVLGPDYTVATHSAGEYRKRRFQGVYELAARMLTRAVLDGTEPGDDEAIMNRLFSLVPGYAEVSRTDLVKNHIRRVLRLPLAQFTPSRQLN